MRDVIYKDNIVHKFIKLYIENYVDDVLSWYEIKDVQIKKIVNNEYIFNKISKIIFNIDITKKMIDELVNNDNIKDYDINYNESIIEEIFNYYNMKKEEDIYILDISSFLLKFPSLSIKYAISFYTSTNIYTYISSKSKKKLLKK